MSSHFPEQPAVLNFNSSGSGGPSVHEPPVLILASGSPRRQELLDRFWAAFTPITLIPAFDELLAIEAFNQQPGREIQSDDQRTAELAMVLSDGKIKALQQQFSLPERYVAIAADTLVVRGGQVFGKPANQVDAALILRQLSGSTHHVVTGLSLVVHFNHENHLIRAAERTAVRFAKLSDEHINWYVSTGEPLDKAGAYGIQGYGAALVEGIEGCYYNVMGLPVHRLMAMLQEAAGRFSSFSGLSDLLPWH